MTEMLSRAVAGSKTPSGIWQLADQIPVSTPFVPAAWNIGANTSQTCSSAGCAIVMLCIALEIRLRCDSMTPFDAPVVPPV